MRKFLITLIIILLLALLGFFLLEDFYYEETQITSEEEVLETRSLCYQYQNKTEHGFYDRSRLRLDLTGDEVSGRFENTPAERDSKVGDFSGVVSPLIPEIMGRRANLWYEAHAEGTVVTEELIIEFGDGSAVPLYKERIDRGDGVYIYKEDAEEFWGPTMNQIACEDLEEVKLVEAFVHENIATIATNDEVLGGAWYAISVFVNYVSDKGEVIYEDGHITSEATFDYRINTLNNTVDILNFENIE